MVDIKSHNNLYQRHHHTLENHTARNHNIKQGKKTDSDPLFLRPERLREAMELLFFAYRDFTNEADIFLEKHQYGRAHHRAIYFIARHQGITVGTLLEILKIRKQSLSRVLKDLVQDGYVIQEIGKHDKRLRLLFLSDIGKDLEKQISEKQYQLLTNAFKNCGADAVAGFRYVMKEIIINENDRQRFDSE